MKVAVLARGDYSLAIRRVQLLREFGVKVFFISINEHSTTHEDNYHINVPNLVGLRYFFAIPSVFRLLLRLRPDLVDCHGASSYGLLSWVVRCPLVISIYGPDLYDHGLRNRLTKIVISRILHRASLITCSSSSLYSYLEPYGGLSDLRTAIIPYGTQDIEQRELRRRNIREDLCLSDDDYCFIHTRRFMEFWRVEQIVDAFVNLGREDSKLIFVFPRPNEQEEFLLSKLRNVLDVKGVGENVFFIQDLPYDEFLSYLAAADCFVCIGQNDLMANSLIEAMVAKNALILNKQESYLEHLKGLSVRWVHDSEDSSEIAFHMQECINQSIGEQSQQVELLYSYALEKFSAKAAARSLLDEYKTLVVSA